MQIFELTELHVFTHPPRNSAHLFKWEGCKTKWLHWTTAVASELKLNGLKQKKSGGPQSNRVLALFAFITWTFKRLEMTWSQ